MKKAVSVSRIAVYCLLASSLNFVACAPKGAGPSSTIVVKSTPSGAQVTFSTGERCTTPCSISKRKGDDFKVTIAKDGYKSQTVLVKKFVAGFAGDTASSASATVNKMWSGLVRYTPNPVVVKLEPSWTRR